MIPLDLPRVSVVGFGVEASHAGDVIQLKLTGRAHVTTGAPLHRVLVRLHTEAMRLGVRQVTVDFRGVELMNSACFKSFLTWLDTAQQASPATRYRVHFISDAHKQWQRRTLAALGYFAADLAVEVEEV
jgi:ABC-type transporter Mla MlaB component